MKTSDTLYLNHNNINLNGVTLQYEDAVSSPYTDYKEVINNIKDNINKTNKKLAVMKWKNAIRKR